MFNKLFKHNLSFTPKTPKRMIPNKKHVKQKKNQINHQYQIKLISLYIIILFKENVIIFNCPHSTDSIITAIIL